MEPAGSARVERRLAAILAADVAGYSRLMGADEEGTLERLKALRRELLDPKIAEHHGRIPGLDPGTRPPATACWILRSLDMMTS
jgi:class 3 adenylate cyclase